MICRIDKFLLLCLLLACICACNKPSASLALGELPEVAIIKHGEPSEELIMFPPRKMHADSRNNLFFFSPDLEHSILMFNPRTGKEIYWGTSGGGQDDFSQPTCVSFSENQLSLYSFNSRKMVQYNYEVKENKIEMIGERYYSLKSDTVWIRDLRRLDNGFYVGFDPAFTDYSYVLFDEDMKILKRFGAPDIENMHFKFNTIQMLTLGNRLFCGASDTGYMECFEINDKAETKRLWSMNLNPPSMLEDGSNWDFESLREGFSSLCSDGKHVFALFRDKLFKVSSEDECPFEHILIMNTNGIILKNIEVENTHIKNLCIESNKLYALTGEYRILEFDIDELI